MRLCAPNLTLHDHADGPRRRQRYAACALHGDMQSAGLVGRACRSGFTMIELILVLMILGLSAAIAVPSLAPFSRGRALGDGSAQALALLLHAQDKAVLEGRSIRVEVDTAQGVFVLTELGALGYEDTAQTVGRALALPDSLTLAWDSNSDAATLGYIQFDPDGGHDPAVLRITSSDGRYVLLGAWSPTERFRIYWPNGQEPPR